MMSLLLALVICTNGYSGTPGLKTGPARFWPLEDSRQNTRLADLPSVPTSWGTSSARSAGAREVLRTIWLPDSTGGVVGPARFVYNPSNQSVYVINGSFYVPNVAVCDARTGRLTTVIKTTFCLSSIALSETSNKLYCAVPDSAFLLVIDCRTNQITGTIRLPCPANKLVWSSAENDVYCTRQRDLRIGIIDCPSDSLVADLRIQATPYKLCYNPISNKVYCSSYRGIDIIDAANHIIIQHIDVPGGSHFFTLSTVNNRVYCFNLFHDNAAVIDGVGDTLIASMLFQPGSQLYCAAYNSSANLVYLGDNVDGMAYRTACVYVIDCSTNQAIDTLQFDARMVLSMAYDSTDNRLFVTLLGYPYDDDWFGDLFVIDCASNTVIDTLEVGVWPAYLEGVLWERNWNQIWVGNDGANNLPGYVVSVCAADSLIHRSRTAVGFTPFAGIINLATRKYYCVGRSDNFVLSFDLDNPDRCVLKETGEAVWDILLNPLENKIYCANKTGKTVTIIDGASDSIIKQVPIGSDPDLKVRGLAFNRTDNKVYVASLLNLQRRGHVTVIDGRTNNVLDTIEVPAWPFSMLWNSIDNKLYTASFPGDTITIIDAHADTILSKIPAPDHPWSLVHNTQDDKIYCVNYAESTVVIDGITNQIVRTIGGGAYALAYNSRDNKVYRGRPDGFLDILDGASDSIIKTIQMQSGAPFSLLYNPNTNTLFCASGYPGVAHDLVLVIDGASDAVLESFTIPAQNWHYGYAGGIEAPPRYALILDSANNLVYLNHYSSSKISVISGTVGIQEPTITLRRSALLRVSPNPALHHVGIEWSVPNGGMVRMAIYDVTGKMIRCLDVPDERIYRLTWDGTDDRGRSVPAGIYFCQLKAKNYSATKKFVLLR